LKNQAKWRERTYRFLKTHILSFRTPQQTSLGRVCDSTQFESTSFSKIWPSCTKSINSPPSAIFNIDENDLSTVSNKVPKVVTSKGKKVVGNVSSGERGKTITIVCGTSASGFYVPSAVVFDRKRMREELLAGAPETIAMCSDSGHIMSALFVEWIHHFQEKVRADTEHPVLLLLDKHSAHLSLEAITFCHEHSIHLITLPSHSSHIMQPLDKCFFKPLKLYLCWWV
jgi:hypothetical protein